MGNETYKLECDLTKKVKAWLDVQPDIHWYKASNRYQKGIADCIICCCGYFVAIELKAINGAPTKHQNLFLQLTTGAGGFTGVCYTLDDVKRVIAMARLKYKGSLE